MGFEIFCGNELLRVTSFDKFCKQRLLRLTSFQNIENYKNRRNVCYRVVVVGFFSGVCYSFNNTGNYNYYFYNIIINIYNILKENVFHAFGEFDA